MGSRPRPSATVSAPVTNHGARSGLPSDGHAKVVVAARFNRVQSTPARPTQPSESSPADPAQPSPAHRPRSKAKLTRASESSTDRQPAFDRRPSTPLPRSHRRGRQPLQESFRHLCHPCARTRSATHEPGRKPPPTSPDTKLHPYALTRSVTHVPGREAPPMCPDTKRHPRARTRSVTHVPGREVSPMCPDAKRHPCARTRSVTHLPGREAPPMCPDAKCHPCARTRSATHVPGREASPMCPDANLSQPLPGDGKMTTRTAVWARSAPPPLPEVGHASPSDKSRTRRQRRHLQTNTNANDWLSDPSRAGRPASKPAGKNPYPDRAHPPPNAHIFLAAAPRPKYDSPTRAVRSPMTR